MANGIQEQHGLYGTFQQWFKDAKIPTQEADQNRDGATKPREVVAYVLAHVDKFSPKVKKHVEALREAFRGLRFTDAEAVQILTGELKDGALKLVARGKEYEKEAATAKTEDKPRLLKLAEKSYRLALDLRPHTRLAHEHLATLLYSQGKTEEGRRHANQVILRTQNQKMPELIAWLEKLQDPDIKKKGAVRFAAEALIQDSNYVSLASLYEFAGRDAAAKGDRPKADHYEEKFALAFQQILRTRGTAFPEYADYAPKFSAYHLKAAASAKTEGDRVIHLTAAADYDKNNFAAQMEMGAYCIKNKQWKEANRYYAEAWRINAQAPGLEAAFKAAQLGYIQSQGEGIQADLREVDALLAKGKTSAAEKLLNQAIKKSEERFEHHSKMFWEEPNHQLITSRLDAQVKFQQARILELRAKTPEKLLEAHHLFSLAESSAGVALAKDPKDPGALEIMAKVQGVRKDQMNAAIKRIEEDLGQADKLLAKGDKEGAARILEGVSQSARFYGFTDDIFSPALEKASKDSPAYLIGAGIRRIQDNHKALALKQEAAIQKDMNRIDALLARGDVEAADRLTNQTWGEFAARWNDHFQLIGGDSYFQLSTARIDAEFKLRQARILELKADTPDKMKEAARVYGLAETSINTAIEKAPKDSASYLIRARIRHVREKYWDAVADFSAALEHAPDAATKERIKLEWSFYFQELKAIKAELKKNRELSGKLVVRQPFEEYRAQGREFAVTTALQCLYGNGVWPNLMEGQDRAVLAKEFSAYSKEVADLGEILKNSKLHLALKTYQDDVTKVSQKVGLKPSDLPASVLTFVEMSPDGSLKLKQQPFEEQPGTVAIHLKPLEEQQANALKEIHKIALIRWNQQQAAASKDPLQKTFYESQALILQDKIPAARLKMMDLQEAAKTTLAADPQYFEKNPEIGAMVEQTRKTLKAFSLKALDELSQTNGLTIAHLEAKEWVPKATQAKLSKVLIRALRAEIESGGAATLEEAMQSLKAEHERLKKSGKDFKVDSRNMITPLTKFDEFMPGDPKTIGYLFDDYFGWERDKSFSLLFERETRAGLEKSLTPDAERSYNLRIGKQLRDDGYVPAAAEIFEKLFAKDLEAAKQKITPARLEELKKKAQDERPKLEKEIRKSLKKSQVKVGDEDIQKAVDLALEAQKLRGDSAQPGADERFQKEVKENIEKRRAEIFEKNVQLALDQAVAVKTDLMIRSEAYKYMDSMTGSHDPTSRDAWIEFNGMKDPNDQWDNLADDTWDAIKTELIVMAVTLPLTLGVGTAVRAGLGGTKLAIRLVNAGRWARMATQGGILVSGSVAEGLVQTMLSSAMQNRGFEWKEVGFNVFTSLGFHGGTRLWGKYANVLGIGDDAIQAAIRQGQSAVGKRLGNFAGMMVVQTELSASFNYLMEQFSGHEGPGFWSLERHLGEGVRQLGYHGANWTLNKATRNWASNAELRAKLKAQLANEHYLDLMKTGKHSSTEARKLSVDMAHKDIPSVFGGDDPKKIGADLQARQANRLVEKLGVDPKSVEGQNLAQLLLLSGDIAKLEKVMTADFKDLDGFIRNRLNIDPASAEGKNLMKYISQALAYGAKRDVLLKEFPELGRLLEGHDTAAKQVMSKAGVAKANGQGKLANALVAMAMERGWTPDELSRFGEVLAQKPELLTNIVDKLGGDGKAPFSSTAGGKQLLGILLLDAMRSSPDFDSFAATLMNWDAHANYHLSDIDQAGLLQGNLSLNARVALFRWSAKEGRTREDWNNDLQGILEGRVEFQIKNGEVKRVEVSEAEGGKAQKAKAGAFASLNDVILQWASTEHFSAENQKIAMDGMADRVLRSAGYKPGTPEYQTHREFLLKHFEAVTRGEFNPEDGNWPKVAADLETHLKGGGTMTYLNQDGSQYKLGPAKKTKTKKAVADDDTAVTKVETRTKAGGQTEVTARDMPAAARGQADRAVPTITGAKTAKVGGNKPPAHPGPQGGQPRGKPDRNPVGLLVSVDGIDGFDIKGNATYSKRWSSADKKIPGDPWTVGIVPKGGGEFDLVPVNGKIQYEVRPNKWVDVPKEGLRLKNDMPLKLGDYMFIWNASSPENAGPFAPGTRRAQEHPIGQIFDYYKADGVQETLKKFAERKDTWGEEARDFQKDLKALETLYGEYRSLENDYRKDPTTARREAYNKKFEEVQVQGEKLHTSKYHEMERRHAKALLALKTALFPLESLLVMGEPIPGGEFRPGPNRKMDFSYEVNFKTPEQIADFAQDWSKVPSEKFVSVGIKVADKAKALELVKRMQGSADIKVVHDFEFGSDQKSGRMTIEVNGKRVVIQIELNTAGVPAGLFIANLVREEREQLDLMRAEIRQMKESKQDPAKIADYEKVLAEADATFQKSLRNRQYTADGIPYAEATTAQIGSHNMPEGPGVAGFKTITEIEAKADKIAKAKPPPERIQRYVDHLVKKKKMTQAEAEVQAKAWAEQVTVDARAHQAGRTHIYDTSLPLKPETSHLDAATVDHHGRFANPKNSTEQLVGKMEATLETAKKDPAAMEAAAKDEAAMAAARRGLEEAGVKKPSKQQITEIAAAIREMNLKEVTTDNLADGGWSVWIAKNQARIFADPKLRKLILDATHFEDFTAFGTEYDSKDPGVRLQAALFQKYGAILKDNGIVGSDRFSPTQANKVMNEALAAVDRMVFDPVAREAAATEFFKKVEEGKKVAAEKGFIADASVHSGDTNLSFFDLTKLGDFTVFQQWLALPRVAPAGHPDTIQVSVVPMKPLEMTVDGQAKKADRRLQIVAIPNGRELPSKKGLLSAVEAMNQAEVAKAEALGLTPKKGEEPKAGQLPRDHFEKLWFGKDNVILPNPMKGGSLLSTGDVSAILTDRASGSPPLGLFTGPAQTAQTPKAPAQAKVKDDAEKEAGDKRIAGVASLFAGVLTLFAPDIAHAADKASDVGGGSTAPWIVGAAVLLLGGIGGFLFKRGKATAPQAPSPYQAPRIPMQGGDPWAVPRGSFDSPVDLHVPNQGVPYIYGRGQLGVQDPSLSAGHASFAKGQDGFWYVLDGTLNDKNVQDRSTNGVYFLDQNNQPVRMALGWQKIFPNQLLLMGNTWVRFHPPPEVAPVPRAPEVLSNFKVGLNNQTIDLTALPTHIAEVDVFVGDPSKLSEKAGYSIVVQDSKQPGEPALRGKLRREGAEWIYYAVDANDVVDGNLQPKVPRSDGFIPVENQDRVWFGKGWFHVEGQTFKQDPATDGVQLHFREGRGQDALARAQADRVQPLDSSTIKPLAPPKEAFFGSADPRIAKVEIPAFESRDLVDASGKQVGEAQIIAGNKTGEAGLRFNDGSLVTGKTTEGGRNYQEDGIYMSRFTLPDGTEVKIIAGADGAGGMGGGDVASSAFLQGIHARVAEATAKGKVPLAGELFASGQVAVTKQKKYAGPRAKNATGAGSVIVIVGNEATVATAGDTMVALSRRHSDGSYETIGYSHVDNHASNVLTNGISANMPNLYVIKGLKSGDQFTMKSDGGWENSLGKAYKEHGSSHMRQMNGLSPPTQEVFAALNLLAEATAGRADAAEIFHDVALGNIQEPGQRVDIFGRKIQLPAEKDVDNIFALNYQHGNPLAKTKAQVPQTYRELEPVLSLDDAPTKAIDIRKKKH